MNNPFRQKSYDEERSELAEDIFRLRKKKKQRDDLNLLRAERDRLRGPMRGSKLLSGAGSLLGDTRKAYDASPVKIRADDNFGFGSSGGKKKGGRAKADPYLGF